MAASAAKTFAEPVEDVTLARESLRVTGKITSKGQITIPAEIRRRLGVSTGDELIFETDSNGETRVRKADRYPFEKFLGMGTGVPELEAGPESIIKYFRETRGHDEFDHLD